VNYEGDLLAWKTDGTSKDKYIYEKRNAAAVLFLPSITTHIPFPKEKVKTGVDTESIKRTTRSQQIQTHDHFLKRSVKKGAYMKNITKSSLSFPSHYPYSLLSTHMSCHSPILIVIKERFIQRKEKAVKPIAKVED